MVYSRKMATAALNPATTRAEDAGVPYERTTLEGFPHEAIAEYSAEHDVDLIVVGASDRSGLIRIIVTVYRDDCTPSCGRSGNVLQ